MKIALSATLSVALMCSCMAPAVMAQSDKTDSKKVETIVGKTSLLLPKFRANDTPKGPSKAINNSRAVLKSGKK